MNTDQLVADGKTIIAITAVEALVVVDQVVVAAAEETTITETLKRDTSHNNIIKKSHQCYLMGFFISRNF
jgi:hypothetical protein